MNIFISYRTEDSDWVSMSLYNSLKQQFPKDFIFRDAKGIKAGDDFTNVIDSNLYKCDVLLALIGENWLHCKDANGNQRLFNSNDYVCMEIATALKNGKKVIPVTIKGTKMPPEEALPQSIKELYKMQAVKLDTENFDMDVFKLANAINDALGRRNQFADLVSDVATGKVRQEELVKPETNAGYAIICMCLGALILYMNNDSVGFIVICLAMIACGAYAWFVSSKVKSQWLNKQFDKARQSSKFVKRLSIIAPIVSVVLLIGVIFYQLKQSVDNGEMKQVTDMMKKMQEAAPAQQQQKSPAETGKQIENTPGHQQTTAPEQSNTPAVYTDNKSLAIYQVITNAQMYNSNDENDAIDMILFAGATVEVLEVKEPFVKVRTNLNGEIQSFWLQSNDIRPVADNN